MLHNTSNGNLFDFTMYSLFSVSYKIVESPVIYCYLIFPRRLSLRKVKYCSQKAPGDNGADIEMEPNFVSSKSVLLD